MTPTAHNWKPNANLPTPLPQPAALRPDGARTAINAANRLPSIAGSAGGAWNAKSGWNCGFGRWRRGCEMTREEAEEKAWMEWGENYDPQTSKAFRYGFDAGWNAVAPEVRAVIEQLDSLAEVWGDEGVFRRCRDRLKDAVGVAR